MTDAGGPREEWASHPETADLRRLQTAMEEAQLALSRRMRMGTTDLAAMAHLSFAERLMGPRELSGRLGITPGAATELVDRLEHAGHVERRRDTVDRRRVHLVPTTSAIEEVGHHLRPLVSALDRIVEHYPPAERELIRRFLGEVIQTYHAFAAEPPVSPESPDRRDPA